MQFSKPKRRKLSRWLFPSFWFLACLLFSWAILLPWGPPSPVAALDGSWQLVFQQLPEKGWQCGRDVVFTFGPLGWIFDVVSPANLPWAIAIHAFITFFLVLAAWLVPWRISTRRLPRVLLSCGSVILLVEMRWLGFSLEAFVFLQAWILLLLVCFRRDPVAVADPGSSAGQQPHGTIDVSELWNGWLALFLQCGLIVGMGILALCKFPPFVIALSAIVGVSLSEALHRRVPWQLALWLVTVLTAWIVSGQELSSIVPYVSSCVELSRGYIASMQCRCSDKYVIAYIVQILLLLFAHYWVQRDRNWRFQLVSLGTMAVLLFLLFKASFVRADFGHIPSIAFSCPFVAFFSLCYFRQRFRSNALLKPLFVATAFSMVLAAVCGVKVIDESHCVIRQQRRLDSFWKTLTGTVRYAERYQEALDRAGRDFQAVPDDVSVDLYPFEVGRLLAAGKHYQPRPVIQSYSAYTPKLAELNAAHLRGEKAPDWAFFRIQPIDEQLPTLADGLSWLELFTRYDLHPTQCSEQFGGYLPLLRSDRARSWKKELILEREASFREPIDVPNALQGPIWAEVEIRPNLKGRVKAVVLREPILTVEVEDGSGIQSYRLVRGMAEAGFFLSPLVRSAGEFAWVASTPWNNSAWQQYLRHGQLRRMTFHAQSTSSFQPTVRIRFYRLLYDGWKNDRAAFSGEKLALFELNNTSKSGPPLGNLLSLGEHVGLCFPNGKNILWHVSADNSVAPLLPQTSLLHVRYGILPPGSGFRARIDHGVCTYQIFAIDGNGRGRSIWSAMLNFSPGEKFCIAEADVPVQLSNVRALSFITTTSQPDGGCSPVWLGVTAK